MEEKLKQNWRETRFNHENNPDHMREIMDGRRRTALENLSLRYRRISTLGFAMAGMSCFWYHNPLMGALAPWMATAMVVYFILSGIMCDWFCRGIRTIDVVAMPIAEVAAKAVYYRKKHLQSIAVTAPFAAVLVGGFVYAATGNEWFLTGLTAGGIAGLAIGLMQLRNFMSDYRDLSE